jgi:methyl-accepting chemotaxis protein
MTAATEQLSASIREIARQTTDAATTTATASDNAATTTALVATLSDASREIGDIVITASTGATADGANTTRRSAERVSAAAGEIRGLIGQFTY